MPPPPLGDPSSTMWSFFEHELCENVKAKSLQYFKQERDESVVVNSMNVEPLFIIAKDQPVTISKRHVKVCDQHVRNPDAVYSPVIDSSKEAKVDVDKTGKVTRVDLNGRITGHKLEFQNRDVDFDSADDITPDIICECGCTYVWDCQTPDIRTVLGNMALLTNHAAYVNGGGRKPNSFTCSDTLKGEHVPPDHVHNNGGCKPAMLTLPPNIKYIGFAPAGLPVSFSLLRKLRSIACFAVPIPQLWRNLFENILCSQILLPVMHGVIPNPTLLSHCTLTSQYAYSSITETETGQFTECSREAFEYGEQQNLHPPNTTPLPALPSSTEGVMQGWGRDMVIAMRYIQYVIAGNHDSNEEFPQQEYISTSPTLQSLLVIESESHCVCCDPTLGVSCESGQFDAQASSNSTKFPSSLFPTTSPLHCTDKSCQCSQLQRTLSSTSMSLSNADFSLLHSYTHTGSSLSCPRVHAHTCTPMSVLALVWPAMIAVVSSVTYAATCLSSSPSPTVWIHSFPFMLAPLFLRTAFPHSRLMLSQHTPFPPSDVFKVQAWRKTILDSALKVDAVCFHTYDYARHFLAACQRVLEADTNDSSAKSNDIIEDLDAVEIDDAHNTSHHHGISSMSEHFSNPDNTWVGKESTDVLATQHTAIVALGNGKLGLEHQARTVSVLNAHVGIRWRDLRYLSLGSPSEWLESGTPTHTCHIVSTAPARPAIHSTLPPLPGHIAAPSSTSLMPNIFAPTTGFPVTTASSPMSPLNKTTPHNANTPPSNPQNIPSLKSLSVPNLQQLLQSCNIDHTELLPVSTLQLPVGTNIPPVLNLYNIPSSSDDGRPPINTLLHTTATTHTQCDITSLLACRMKLQLLQQPIPKDPLSCPSAIAGHKMLLSITSCSPLQAPHLVLAAFDQCLRNRPDLQTKTTLVVILLPILGANFTRRYDIARNLRKYAGFPAFTKAPPSCEDLHALSLLYSPCVKSETVKPATTKHANPFSQCARCSQWDPYTKAFYARVQVLKRRYGEHCVKVIDVQPSSNSQHSYCFTDDNAFSSDVCRRATSREEVRHSTLLAQRACSNNEFYATPSSTHRVSFLPHEACSPLCSHWKDPFEKACECKHSPFVSSWNVVNAFGLMKTADVVMTTALSDGLNLACLEATAAQCVQISQPSSTVKVLDSVSKNVRHLGNLSKDQLAAVVHLTEGHLAEGATRKRAKHDLVSTDIHVAPHPILPQLPAMMITSEFQALSRSLAGVLRINPWSHSEFGNAISKCLQASAEEKWNAYQARAHHASTHTFTYWSNACLSQLRVASERNTYANTLQEKHNKTKRSQ